MSGFEAFLRNQEGYLCHCQKLDVNKIRRHILDSLGALYLLQRKERSINTVDSKLFYTAVTMIAENALDAYESFKTEGYLFSDDSPVQEMIKSSFCADVADVTRETSSDEWGSLAWTAVAGDRLSEDEANVLFKEGCDKCLPSQGMQLLRFAAGAKRPHMSFLQNVSGLFPELATTQDSDGLLPLHYAARFTESCEVIDYLLQFHVTSTPIDEKCMSSSQSIVRAGHSSEVATPLLCLLQRDFPAENAVDMVKSMLAADPASARVTDTNQYTPLHHACRNIKTGLSTIVDALLAVTPELASALTNDGITAIHCLFDLDAKPSLESTAAMKSILTIDPSVALMTNAFGDLPIHHAAAFGSIEDVRILACVNPDTVKISNRYGKIPLYLAVSRSGQAFTLVISTSDMPVGESTAFFLSSA
jgi:ankyrin repeat protein